MKNLQEIKNTYAIEQGYEDWREFSLDGMRVVYDMEFHMDEVCIRAQKVALEKAAENFYMDWHKSTITNPENLIR